MRYRLNSSSPWVYCRYSMSGMAHVILNDLEYGIHGRDYFTAPTHWGASA